MLSIIFLWLLIILLIQILFKLILPGNIGNLINLTKINRYKKELYYIFFNKHTYNFIFC